MPTYEYVCTQCASPLEVVQSIHERSLTDCPECDGGKLRKLFGNVGVVFKGSGFYRTDNRSKSKGGASDGSSKPATSGSTEGGSAKDSSSTGSAGKDPSTKQSAASSSAATSS